ncbi:MAG: thioesterase family protein [Mycobacteriales bacterium]
MAFYTDLGGGRFRATAHTIGPWDARFQHAGPPSALLGRAIERCEPRAEVMVARVTVEILGAIPVSELTVQARVARPGRSVELVEAVMSSEGRDVARATAWRVRRAQGVQVPSRATPPPPLPEPTPDREVPGWVEGYVQAVEWRWAAGHLVDPGPATVWTRMRHPLLEGEDPSPLTRVLVVADSGNGASSELDIRHWQFINPELTVHLHREAVGEWVCLDATTSVSDGGVGLATSVLSDTQGPLGHGAQSLLVARR